MAAYLEDWGNDTATTREIEFPIENSLSAIVEFGFD